MLSRSRTVLHTKPSLLLSHVSVLRAFSGGTRILLDTLIQVTGPAREKRRSSGMDWLPFFRASRLSRGICMRYFLVLLADVGEGSCCV